MATAAVLDSSDRITGCDLAAASLVNASTIDTFPAGTDIYLRVVTAGTDCTPTVIAASTVAGPRGTFIAPRAMTAVGATGDKLYGPFPADTFADPADGLVHVSWSATTSVKCGVYRITN
jgi:hypothetical protein